MVVLGCKNCRMEALIFSFANLVFARYLTQEDMLISVEIFLCSYLNSVVVKPTTKKNLQDTGLVLEERHLPMLWFCC